MGIIKEIANIINLHSFRNKYDDRECFIVGNGPSVDIEDLKKIQSSGKIIFTFNRFYMAYQQLELDFFRPDFLLSIDPQMVNDFGQEMIDNRNDATVFFGMNSRKPLRGKYVSFYIKNRLPFVFQSHPYRKVSTGDSSVIAAIQLAFFMGMRKIYLYGVDHNFEHEDADSNGMVEGGNNHFIKGYRSGKKWYPPMSKNIETAFIKSDEYLRRHNGFILNCSRKTKLNDIERVSLNDCL